MTQAKMWTISVL